MHFTPDPRRLTRLATALVFAASAAAAEGLTELWRTTGFNTPESVALDAATGVIYVSNIAGDPMAKDGNGFIAQMAADGVITTLNWVTGLDAPKGMDVVGGTLYVADIDRLVEIDIASATVTNRYPVAGAGLLNDVIVAPDGRVFVSDTATSTIHVLEAGNLTAWLTDPMLMGANGLTIIDGMLVVAQVGDISRGFDKTKPGQVVSVDLASKATAFYGVDAAVGVLDGIEPDGAGGVLVTDFMGGRILSQMPGGAAVPIGILSMGTADFEFVADQGLVLVPVMPENAVVALRWE